MLTVADACPACGGRIAPWRSVPSSEPALAGIRFELARCEHCGTAVTCGDAQPELYETGAYRPGTPRLHPLALPLLRRFDRRRLALLEPFLETGMSLLDVGAGRGRFVATAREEGYEARGIEPSRRGATAAQASGVPVEQVGVEEAALASESVDAISLWHVLEHLDRPGIALERIAEWLRPGGVVLVGVPNLASVQARLGGDHWYHLDVPRHRVHFTQAGIEALLRNGGFTPVRVHHVLAEQNPFGMWQSLVSRGTRHPSYLYNLLKHNAPVRSRDLAITVLALPLAPLAALTELVAGLAGLGGTIAVVARRTRSG